LRPITTLSDAHERGIGFIIIDLQVVNILIKETYLHIYWGSKLGKANGTASQVLDTHVRGAPASPYDEVETQYYYSFAL
jgi:hypothetical protein